jgi:hypothetical protein
MLAPAAMASTPPSMLPKDAAAAGAAGAGLWLAVAGTWVNGNILGLGTTRGTGTRAEVQAVVPLADSPVVLRLPN